MWDYTASRLVDIKSIDYVSNCSISIQVDWELKSGLDILGAKD
jgi:hypothetical protein